MGSSTDRMPEKRDSFLLDFLKNMFGNAIFINLLAHVLWVSAMFLAP